MRGTTHCIKGSRRIVKNKVQAAFDLQVQLYDEEQGKASHGDDKNVEDYVLPFTMNDFDDESDKNASVAPGRLAVAEEEFSRREATQQSSAGAHLFRQRGRSVKDRQT